MPPEDCVWSAVRMKPQKVSIAVAGQQRPLTGYSNSRAARYQRRAAPGLEDEGEVLLPEDDPGRVPADPLHVNVDHHQVGAFLVRVVLHKLQVDHRLQGCKEDSAARQQTHGEQLKSSTADRVLPPRNLLHQPSCCLSSSRGSSFDWSRFSSPSPLPDDKGPPAD